MERARELIRPYVDREGVVGIYLVGSATRPFRDPLSDYDLEVVVDDAAYAATPSDQRHVFVIDEGPPRRVDHEFYLRSWSDFAALVDSRQDVVRAGYRHAVVLHDPQGRVAPVVERLAELPAAVRDARLRVHWLELLFGLGRARKTLGRGKELDARLVLTDALRAAVKLLFVAAGAWPAPTHWTREELALLEVPAPLLDRLATCATSIDLEDWAALHADVRAHLAACGLGFHEDAEALTRWAFLTAEGRAAFERWGAT
jgi:hypothetical protein